MKTRKFNIKSSIVDKITFNDFWSFSISWMEQNKDDYIQQSGLIYTIDINGNHMDFIDANQSKFVRMNFGKQQIEALTDAESDWGTHLVEHLVDEYEEEWFDMLGWGEGPSAFQSRYLTTDYKFV